MLFILIILWIIFHGPIMRWRMRGANPNIKFDLLDQRKSRKATCICLLLGLASFGVFIFCVAVSLQDIRIDLVSIIATFSMGIWAFMTALEGERYIKSHFYFKRLEQYGYEIPQNKKDYGNKLGNLPCTKETKLRKSEDSQESRTLTLLALLALAIDAIYSFKIYWHYLGLDQELAMEGFVLLLFPQICWVICSIVFWRQRNREKYRDDVEVGDNRKLRAQLEEGISEILHFAGLTCIYVAMVLAMLKISFRARQ